MTLNSNMYIKGLSLLDYMDLGNKVIHMSKAYENHSTDNLEMMIAV